MAKAATARTEATPLSGPLPEEIVIWEILVRLPPKSLVRCRAVRRAWRRITSTHHFLLAHHGHQPSLPLLSGRDYGENFREDIIAFDHRAVTAAAKIQPLARLIDPNLCVVASCDGLLVMSIDSYNRTDFFVCNPPDSSFFVDVHGVMIKKLCLLSGCMRPMFDAIPFQAEVPIVSVDANECLSSF